MGIIQMTTIKRYITFDHIRKMPNYTAVHEELETFLQVILKGVMQKRMANSILVSGRT